MSPNILSKRRGGAPDVEPTTRRKHQEHATSPPPKSATKYKTRAVHPRAIKQEAHRPPENTKRSTSQARPTDRSIAQESTRRAHALKKPSQTKGGARGLDQVALRASSGMSQYESVRNQEVDGVLQKKKGGGKKLEQANELWPPPRVPSKRGCPTNEGGGHTTTATDDGKTKGKNTIHRKMASIGPSRGCVDPRDRIYTGTKLSRQTAGRRGIERQHTCRRWRR